jgi:hypothetical protein
VSRFSSFSAKLYLVLSAGRGVRVLCVGIIRGPDAGSAKFLGDVACAMLQVL